MSDDNEPPAASKLTRSKERWAREGKFLTGKISRPEQQRLPPGQHLTKDWPTLDLGVTPNISRERWRLDVYGAVEHPLFWDFAQFTAQPQSHFTSDIHCVTTWSRYDNQWEGLATRDLLMACRPREEARFVVLHSYDGYTTNLALEDFATEDALLAHSWSGALFAHCFTCGKDVLAAKRISAALALKGIAVLRFDFTGLGSSEGDFANSTFSSNVADLVRAADHLRETRKAPAILIGHSLGGAAILAAAAQIPDAKAVVTIAAPSDPAHVTGLFKDRIEDIRKSGDVEVSLAGRPFHISSEFLDDIAEHNLMAQVTKLHKALLIMHAPADETVGIDNANPILVAAKPPK